MGRAFNEDAYDFIVREEPYSVSDIFLKAAAEHVDNSCVFLFSRDLRLQNYTPRILHWLKETPPSEETLVNKELLYFAPDFEEMGIIDKLDGVLMDGEDLNLECYQVAARDRLKPTYAEINFFEVGDRLCIIVTDISELVSQRQTIDRYEREILQLKRECTEMNTTISTLLKKYSLIEEQHESAVCSNIEQVVIPVLDALRATKLSDRQQQLVDVLTYNLESITEPILKAMTDSTLFSHRETEIATLIRQGKTTKEIASILWLSPRTVDFHRANIRRKLGIVGIKDNLQKKLVSHVNNDRVEREAISCLPQSVQLK